MANKLLDLSKFLPEKLRDKPIYSKIITLLDCVIENFYQDDYENIKNAYNVFDNHELIIKVLADEDLQKYLKLTGQEGAELIWLLNLMQRLRGTKRGFKFLLKLVGLENAVITERKDDSSISPCSIEVDVGSATDYDISQIQEILSLFLHMCISKDVVIATSLELEFDMVMETASALSIYL